MNIFTFVAPVYNVMFSTVQKRQGNELLCRLSPLVGKTALDLGGGTGRLATQMTAAGADVWILDATPQMIKQARRVLPPERAVIGDAASLPFPDNFFNIITVVDVFHHIRRQDETLRECYRVIQPGGSLYLLEFDPEFLSIRLLACIERVLGEPSLFLSPGNLKCMLTNAGFTQVETEYIVKDEYIMRGRKL